MRALLNDNGTYEAINGQPLEWLRGMLELFIFKPLFGLRFQPHGYDLFLLVPSTATLEEMARYIDAGTLGKPIIDTVFDVLDAESLKSGFEKIKGRRTVGKIVYLF